MKHTFLLALGDDRAGPLDPIVGAVEVQWRFDDSTNWASCTLRQMWKANDGSEHSSPVGSDFYLSLARMAPDDIGALHLGPQGGIIYYRLKVTS